MKVLGIETSCDETAAAIVGADRHIYANVIRSQFDVHREHGGVVPEIAARAHLDAMNDVVNAALKEANMGWDDIDAIAATAGPGLIGGVMVGLMAGKSYAAYMNKPFIGVNHLEGHALSPRLSDDVPFPYLLLLVSGGHSQILLCKGIGQYAVLGKTLDDAAGECFDKSAKLLGLPQPGGPNLSKLAALCDDPAAAAARFDLPFPLIGRAGCDFSFSGMKTAMRERIEGLMNESGEIAQADAAALACAFEQRMADILARQCERALTLASEECAGMPVQYRASEACAGMPVKYIVTAGGVAANTRIRERLKALAAKQNIGFAAPPAVLCTDNGAMIAWAGLEHLRLGRQDTLDVAARPRWPLQDIG